MIDSTLWDRLDQLDPGPVCPRAHVHYDPDRGVYRVPLVGRPYLVCPAQRTVTMDDADGPGPRAGFQEHLICVVYLLNASAREPSGKLVKPESLPAGEFFFRHLHAMPTAQVEQAFGPDPEGMIEAGRAMGAPQVDFGDVAIQVPALPRVPLTYIVWAADEEFPAKASILVDETAADQLPLDALWALAGLATKWLVRAHQAEP